MPTKIVILTNCSACPHKVWNSVERVCRLSGYKIINTPLTEIPAWCELENYAETEEKADKERERAKI